MGYVLLISPHPDDSLYGVLGYILKNHYDKKYLYLILSRGERGCNNISRIKQILNFLKDEGIDIAYELEKFEDTKLYLYIPQIADLIRQKIREYNVKLVFTTSERDGHQDHIAASKSTKIVGRYLDINIIEYYTPSSIGFQANAFLPLTEDVLKLKIKILKLYQKPRQYYDEEFLKSIHRFYGLLSGVRYAEPYIISKWILR